MPILLAATGGLLGEASGLVNVGLEGLMLVSAFFAVVTSAATGSAWLGLLAGVASALLLSAAFGYFTLNLEADPIISGFALNILASGLTVFLMSTWFGDKGSYSPPGVAPLPQLELPWLAAVPVIGPVLAGHNVLVYIGLASVFVIHWLLYRTPFGLRLRAVGEHQEAAASVGINVKRMRYIAVLMTGLFTGLAGANLSLGYLNMFVRDMTAGRGFIALAAIRFGGMTPIGTLLASLFFGFTEAAANRLQAFNLPSHLMLMIPYLFTVIAAIIYAIRRRKPVGPPAPRDESEEAVAA